MKAVLFTLDAIFALAITIAAISILIFFQYYSQTPYSISYSNSQGIMTNLASTSVESLQNSSNLAQIIANQYIGANETWPAFLGGPQQNSSNIAGPSLPIVSYTYKPGNTINTGIVADYGGIYFAAGNNLYSVNASTNATAWVKNTISNVVSTPVLYNGAIYFINSTNLTAVSAKTGTLIWSTNNVHTMTPITTPLSAYENEIIFGGSDHYIHSFYATNGTQLWSNSLGTTNPISIVVQKGSVVVNYPQNSMAFLLFAGASAQQLASTAYVNTNPLSNRSAGSGSEIFFGSGISANAVYTNGSVVAGAPAFPVHTPANVVGVGVYKSYVIYQTQNSMVALTPSGAAIWSVVTPSQFGAALENATPVVSGKMVYSLWTNGLEAQNLSTGSVSWFSLIPKVKIYPYMTLAYGNLYVIANNKILAYGDCGAPLHASVLAAVATMYYNSQPGCSGALLNAASPLANYSIFVGNPKNPTVKTASFGGSSGFISARNSQSLNYSFLAASFWINISSYPSTGVRLVNYGDNATCLSPITQCGWMFYLTNTGVLKFSVMNNQQYTANSLVLNRNTWYLITGTYNGTVVGLYINGGAPFSTNASGGLSQTSPNINLTIGGGLPSDTRYFSGNLANLQVYKFPFLGQQVSQLYLRGIQGIPLRGVTLVAWYPLDGDANDYSLFNPGFITGAVKFSTQNAVPVGFRNSYQISKASTLMPVINYTTGVSNTLPVGVYSWS